jgi:hypothetical protein
MSHVLTRLTVTLLLVAVAQPLRAQTTADEVVEKSVAALGGRAAHKKLTSRSMAGTITLSTPAGEIAGTIEVQNATPNKVRTVINADLSAFGAGQLVVDQRFDGDAGYVLDSLQGNREITGGMLDNFRNNSFPHVFLTYKDLGIAATLGAREKVGDREVHVVIFDPTSGPLVRHYIDAETYLPAKTVVTIEIPQLGRDVEQSTEFLDYREVDGVKTPFRIRSSSSVQSFTVTISKLEHNVKIDDALFVKPKAF